MTLPPSTINDVPKSIRSKLQRLFYERALLGYVFSFAKLEQFMNVSDMQQCIVAWKEDEAKDLKADLNDRITSIYTENGIEKTLRDVDPFGRPKDYIMMEGSSTSFSQNRALEIAVAGVYRWDCRECETTNYTQSNKAVKCRQCETPHARVTEFTLVQFEAEALTAVFALATTKTSYVSLQARDVKESNERGKGK